MKGMNLEQFREAMVSLEALQEITIPSRHSLVIDDIGSFENSSSGDRTISSGESVQFTKPNGEKVTIQLTEVLGNEDRGSYKATYKIKTAEGKEYSGRWVQTGAFVAKR